MSQAIKFDTLAYANKLKNTGMENNLAEALAEAQGEVIGIILDDQLDMKQDIISVKNDVKDLRYEMSAMENRLMTKLGSIMVAGFGILATLLTILHLFH